MDSHRHINIILCGDAIATFLLMVATCGDVATICPPLGPIPVYRLKVRHNSIKRSDVTGIAVIFLNGNSVKINLGLYKY